MTRVLSGAVLIAIAVAVVWLAPPAIFFCVAEVLLVLAFVEYSHLAAACGLPIPLVASGIATIVASIGVTSTFRVGETVITNAIALDAALMTASVMLAAISIASWRGDREALARAAVSAFPALYLGLPIGAMVAIRTLRGPDALFLLLL